MCDSFQNRIKRRQSSKDIINVFVKKRNVIQRPQMNAIDYTGNYKRELNKTAIKYLSLSPSQRGFFFFNENVNMIRH